jgi:hypothetical protein
MKIAQLEMYPGDGAATGERGRAISRWLRDHGHHVDVLAPDPGRLRDFSRFRFSVWSRLKRRALRQRFLPHLWEYVADDLEPRIRRGGYDATIARAYSVAFVLTRGLPGLKIADVANVGFLEHYHSWSPDLAEVDKEWEMEMAVYRACDAILLPHEILAGFFRRYVYDDAKVLTVRLGADPALATARYAAVPRIVYAGSYDYFQDPFLLGMLAQRSPCPIHFYGPRDPSRQFLQGHLDYRGFAPNASFLAEYQLGLITVSHDRLRQHSPSTKFAYYFAHGLPALFPAWMKEGYGYEAALPYDESSFAEVVAGALGDESRWRELSRKAKAIAADLTWDRVLSPLAGVLQRAEASGRPKAGS